MPSNVVALRALNVPPSPDGYAYFEQITFSTGTPPDRPHPGPNPPDGIWGPNDPRPTHPIAGIPGLPGYEPGPGLPGGPGGGQLPEGSKLAVVKQAAEQPTVPEGLPAGSVLMDVKFGKDQEGQAWGLPYKSPHV